MRFVGLTLHDAVPDAKTIWLYREQLARAATERLFARFGALLREEGWLAMGGQLVDATVIEARQPRLARPRRKPLKAAGHPPSGRRHGAPDRSRRALDSQARQEARPRTSRATPPTPPWRG
jgi:hypothetical protein